MLELVACGSAWLAVDQWSKRLVTRRAAHASMVRSARARVPDLSAHAHRSPGAHVTLVLVWCGALASAIALHQSGSWFQSTAAQWGLASAFGGAAGNLLDTLRHRSVVDFIDLGWWPVFNLADVAIVGGLIVALLRN
jgi:lipoprotein signal peptidase